MWPENCRMNSRQAEQLLECKIRPIVTFGRPHGKPLRGCPKMTIVGRVGTVVRNYCHYSISPEKVCRAERAQIGPCKLSILKVVLTDGARDLTPGRGNDVQGGAVNRVSYPGTHANSSTNRRVVPLNRGSDFQSSPVGSGVQAYPRSHWSVLLAETARRLLPFLL